MEVFDYSNVLIASYFTDNRGCAHENRDHTLIYLCSGELEIEERGRRTVLRAGDCAFLRRDNRMWLQKRIVGDEPYHSITLKFSKAFLREFYQQRLNLKEIPAESRRDRASLWILPRDRADVRSLFESVIPYFESGEKPSEEILKLKMVEGVYVLLHTDSSLYASLFDFVEPWKIDILDYLLVYVRRIDDYPVAIIICHKVYIRKPLCGEMGEYPHIVYPSSFLKNASSGFE